MSNVDTRQVNRDSLFLLAQVRVDGQDAISRVKVRNLSAGGMMAEGDSKVVARLAGRGRAAQHRLGRRLGRVEAGQPLRHRVRRRDRSCRGARAGGAAGRAEFERPRYTRNHQAVPITPAGRLEDLTLRRDLDLDASPRSSKAVQPGRS